METSGHQTLTIFCDIILFILSNVFFYPQVKVMAQMLVELSGTRIAPTTVDKVAQLVQNADSSITPSKIKSIADMVESLSNEVPPGGVELVSSMAQKMGPVLSHRETQMISRMAARSGIELTMNDIHVLTDITNSVGKDLSNNDIEIISILTKKVGSENAETAPAASASVDEDTNNKLSMTVRLKKPTTTEKPMPEMDDPDFESFGMKENSNKGRKQPLKIANSDNLIRTTQPPATSTTSPGASSVLRIRRPPTTTTTTTTASTEAVAPTTTTSDEDILKTNEGRRRRPVPLRIAPGRGSSSQQQDDSQVDPTTTSTTTTTPPPTTTTITTTTTPFTTTSTTTTSTTTPFTTSRQRSSTSKPQRFNSPSDAATMLNNALGNPVGNSFMQFFMGNKELNNIGFVGDKLSPATAKPQAVPQFNEAPFGTTEPSDLMKLLTGAQDQESLKVNQPFEKLVKPSDFSATTAATVNQEQIPAVEAAVPAGADSFAFGNNFGDFLGNGEFQKPEFPDFSTMLSIDPSDIGPTRPSSPDPSIFRTSNNFEPQQSGDNSGGNTGGRVNISGVNPQAALMNFLLKSNLKEPGTTLPTSFDPFLRETTTLDKTPSGNFMQILMGHERLNVGGKSNEVFKKLEKKKIPLDPAGNNFMAMAIGDQVQRFFCFSDLLL